MEEFIEHEDHESSQEKLGDDQERSDQTELANWTIHSGKKISQGFTEGYQKSEKFLRSLEELSVFFALHVDVDHLGTDEELHNHTTGDDGAHTKFHNGTLV